MKTQTALYTWTAPDGTPRYLIAPDGEDGWRDGQAWAQFARGYYEPALCPVPERGPVWVCDLFPTPVPLPEVHWIDGHPVAMLHSLPDGVWFSWSDGSPRLSASVEMSGRRNVPVIVVSWPDGSKPCPPTLDGAR